jgi:hypothetical protein
MRINSHETYFLSFLSAEAVKKKAADFGGSLYIT